MTNKEAIDTLTSIRDYLCRGNPIWRTEPIHDAVNMAVDALRKTENSSEQTDLVEDSPSLVKDLVKAFGEDGTWLERQGVYTLTLAEAKQRAVDIIESVLAKDEPQTERSE